MKLYNVEFKAVNPVPHGLIILAHNIDQARELARERLLKKFKYSKDIKIYNIEEIKIDEPKVIFFESGDY